MLILSAKNWAPREKPTVRRETSLQSRNWELQQRALENPRRRLVQGGRCGAVFSEMLSKTWLPLNRRQKVLQKLPRACVARMILNRRESHRALYRGDSLTSFPVALPPSGLGLRVRCLHRRAAFRKSLVLPPHTYLPSEQDFLFVPEGSRARPPEPLELRSAQPSESPRLLRLPAP